MRPFHALALCALLPLAAACDSPTQPGPGTPAAMAVVSGDLQRYTVGKELPEQLVVRVTDDKGRPVEGQIVNFRVTAGGGSVFAGTALTNGDGEARERWTLGTVAGDTQRVEARAVDPGTGAALVFAEFRAVGTADAPAAVTAVGAPTLFGLPSLPLADSVAVFVRDVYGNPVPGQTVAWTVLQGGGAASPASSVTGPGGVARTQWTLGPQYGGAQVLQASAGLTVQTQFTANAQLPAGAALVMVSGDGQTGSVGQALDLPLVARVQLADGRPVAGIPVTFSVHTSYGSVSPATAVSDASGQVSVRWTLGTLAGPMEVQAAIPTGSTVTFRATARPGPVATLRKVAGDGQQGRAGSVLADSLVVQALDAFNNPVPGATVTWSAPAGSVSPATATTRADGTARTAYTLPSTGGTATVQASVPGAEAVAFQATSINTPVYMRILQPTAGAVAADTVGILVAIDSSNASVSSVRATAAGRTVELHPTGTPRRVGGAMGLIGLPVGTLELRVVATTVNGDSTVATVTFEHDGRPVLTILQPVRNTVARPELRVDVDCTDDAPAGCASVTVTAASISGSGGPGTVELASGTTGIHGTFSLAAFDGRKVLLQFRARDARGTLRTVSDTVFVESSAALTEVASAGVRMLDADADGGRVLYADSAATAWIRSGSTATSLAQGVEAHKARLHPYGAIVGQSSVFTLSPRVYDWNAGTLYDLGPLNAGLETEGSWAIWSNGSRLYRRDLATRATAEVATDANNWRNDVTATGLVAYGSAPYQTPNPDSYDIYTWDGTATTRLTSDPDGTYRNHFPVTDGTSVLYDKYSPASNTNRIALWRNGTETILTPAQSENAPRRNYDANGGWIAWTAADAVGILQVHLRSPGGVDRQLTTAGTRSELRALGADGTVVFATGGWLYALRAPHTGTPVRIAHDWDMVHAPRFVGTDLMLFLGRTAFRVSF